MKKRNKNLEIDQKSKNAFLAMHNLAQDEQLRECINTWLKKSFDLNELHQLVEAVNSPDRIQNHYGVIGLRKVLSNGLESFSNNF